MEVNFTVAGACTRLCSKPAVENAQKKTNFKTFIADYKRKTDLIWCHIQELFELGQMLLKDCYEAVII